MTRSTPFQLRNGLVVIPVQIKGPSGETIAKLAVDTGATTTMLSERVLRLVGCRLTGSARKEVMLTAGGPVLARRVTVRKIGVAGHSRRSLSVICHALPDAVEIDGLLGLDFFDDTNLRIDFRERRISVE